MDWEEENESHNPDWVKEPQKMPTPREDYKEKKNKRNENFNVD